MDYTIRSGHLSFSPSPDGTHQGKFEFQFAVYDEENRAVFGQWTRAETLYTAKQIDELATGHFHFQQTLAIPTQAAWLGLIVRDVIGEHIGSLEIPPPLSPEPDPAHDVKGQAN